MFINVHAVYLLEFGHWFKESFYIIDVKWFHDFINWGTNSNYLKLGRGLAT